MVQNESNHDANGISYIDRVVLEVENADNEEYIEGLSNEDLGVRFRWRYSTVNSDRKHLWARQVQRRSELREQGAPLLETRQKSSVTGGSNSKTLYHVHRSALAAGSIMSGYFEALFKSGQFSEPATSTSVVELPGTSLWAFLLFLTTCTPSHPNVIAFSAGTTVVPFGS